MPQRQPKTVRDVVDCELDPAFPPPSRRKTPQSDSGSRETDKSKKKDKKWSLGGLFRRKKTKGTDTDSSSETEEVKKGFLVRRRSARKKNRGSKDVSGSFEHVVINPTIRVSGEAEVPTQLARDSSNDRVSHELICRGSSGSLESGRRSGRHQIKARVKASRDRLRVDSSSDEGSSSRLSNSSAFKSDEQLGSSRDGSVSRRSRAARTERYIKRLSRDEDSIKDLAANQRLTRSDDRLVRKNEVRVSGNNRWTAKVVYQESSDYETKYRAKTHSASPSPVASPKTKPKNLGRQTSSVPIGPAFPTFPPSHGRDAVSSQQEHRSKSYRNSFAKINRPSPILPHRTTDLAAPSRLPKTCNDTNLNRQIVQKPTQNFNLPHKSASYDCNINSNQTSHPHLTDLDVLVVQFPIARVGKRPELEHTQMRNESKQSPPPPPPRDPRRIITQSIIDSPNRPISYACDSKENPKLHQYTDYNANLATYQYYPHPIRAIGIQQRSNSDQQIPAQFSRPVMYSPPSQRRPASVLSESQQRRVRHFKDSSRKNQVSEVPILKVPHHYQYYTDQQPRSRKPIHIAYNLRNNEKPYLSDSQVVTKAPSQPATRVRPMQQPPEFWNQNDLVSAKRVNIPSPTVVHKQATPITSSRSNSPHQSVINRGKLRAAPLILPSAHTDSSSSQSVSSDLPSPRICYKVDINMPSHSDHDDGTKKEPRPLSVVAEKSELVEKESPRKKVLAPPMPPVRISSRQSSVSSVETSELAEEVKEKKRKSSNLEEALNELEAIYNSLRLGEEDVIDKAGERNIYQDGSDPAMSYWVRSRGFESDSSYNYGRTYKFDETKSPRRGRLPESNGVPDIVMDDMAYRRLNRKSSSSPDTQNLVSQAGSFLLVSPTLSPAPFAEPSPLPSSFNEPDITLDDVVYRSIKHVNNSLKVLEPQPPFGIPLGPLTPAPNSDYLHVTPKQRYRSSFKPRKTPDVVSDDLAFRNLRKDDNKGSPSLVKPEGVWTDPNFTLKKKRAVRSLSANLMNIIERENEALSFNNNNISLVNNNVNLNEMCHSFTDLPVAVKMAQTILAGKDTIGGRAGKFSSDPVRSVDSVESDVTPRISKPYPREYSAFCTSTSTETLTDSRLNLQPRQDMSADRKQKVNLPTLSASVTPRKSFLDCIIYRDPTTKDKEVDSSVTVKNAVEQTETELLEVLANEARATSEQIGRELHELSVGNTRPNETLGVLDAVDTNVRTPQDHWREKKDCVIGKIVQHRPVKLNTFYITHDDRLENRLTCVTADSPLDDMPGNRSMTNLLKELTKSVDYDLAAESSGSTPTDTLGSVCNEAACPIAEQLERRRGTSSCTMECCAMPEPSVVAAPRPDTNTGFQDDSDCADLEVEALCTKAAYYPAQGSPAAAAASSRPTRLTDEGVP